MATAPPPPSSLPPPTKKRPPPRVAKAFDVDSLPSVKLGMTPSEETKQRRRTCRFIEEAGGRSLKLPRVAVATAMVFFHRFYAKHAFQEHDRFEVAVACLLLAAKTEESPKKLSLVITECWKLKNRAASSAGGNSPGPGASPSSVASGSAARELDTKGEEYIKLKERILLLERVILHTIGFELSIDHPYKFLVDQIQKLNKGRQLEYISPPKPQGGMPGTKLSTSQLQTRMVQELVQNAMNFANDSMHTSLCIQFPARIIAMACVYMSGRYCKSRPTGGRSWLDVLDGIEMEELASTAVQIMELIAAKKGGDLDVFKTIRADLNEMRETRQKYGNTVSGKASGASSSLRADHDSKRPRTG